MPISPKKVGVVLFGICVLGGVAWHQYRRLSIESQFLGTENSSKNEKILRDARSPLIQVIPVGKEKERSKLASKLYPEHAPLSSEEQAIFEKNVHRKIRRMLDWGKLSDEELHEYQRTLFTLADRGVAEETRKLDALRKGKPLSEEQSAQAISGLDTLLFLAKQGHPLSREALLKLASRPTRLNGDGTFSDPLASTVTFEAFQALVVVNPNVAQAIIHEQTGKVQLPFVYHYIVGRLLAGQDREEAIADARSSFGEKLVADVGF